MNNVERLRELIGDLSHDAVREVGIRALRRWRTQRPDERSFQMNGPQGFGTYFVELVAETKRVSLMPDSGPITSDSMPSAMSEAMIAEASHESFMHPLYDFFAWLQVAGLVQPWLSGTPAHPFPIWYRATAAGLEFFSETGDHPLLPGYAARVSARCAGLPDTIPVLLADAYACLERSLLRASIVMLGVAFEMAIEAIVEHLAPTVPALAQVVERGAAQRVRELRAYAEATLPQRTNPERDDRLAVIAALDFADQLRRRRNDASHTTPRYGFADRAEAEELLTSSGRHLPVLWRLHA